MGSEFNLHFIIYIEPFRMMIELFCPNGDLTHPAERTNKALKLEVLGEFAVANMPMLICGQTLVELNQLSLRFTF